MVLPGKSQWSNLTRQAARERVCEPEDLRAAHRTREE